jgi:hypothetical protein
VGAVSNPASLCAAFATLGKQSPAFAANTSSSHPVE